MLSILLPGCVVLFCEGCCFLLALGLFEGFEEVEARFVLGGQQLGTELIFEGEGVFGVHSQKSYRRIRI
jgi:hypothetical protein